MRDDGDDDDVHGFSVRKQNRVLSTARQEALDTCFHVHFVSQKMANNNCFFSTFSTCFLFCFFCVAFVFLFQ